MKRTYFFLTFFLFILLFNSFTVGQYVTTVASSSCMISSSTVDSDGNVYFVEYSPCKKIKKVNIFGVISDLLTTSTDVNAIKYHNGYLYLALYEYYSTTKIQRLNLSNNSLEDYVTNCQAPNGLNFIGDTLFFGEYFSQRIYKVLPGGGAVGSPNVIPIQNNVNGIAGSGVRLNSMTFLPDGNFVITTLFGGGKIYKVNRFTGASTLIHTAPTNDLGDIVRNIDGYYYYVGYSNHRIYKVDPDFTSSQVFAGSTAGYADGDISVAKFNQPMYMSVAPNGDLYVGEYSNKKLRRISEIVPPRTDIITVSGDGVFDCPNNGLQFVFAGVNGTGTCSLKVFNNSFAINISFGGNPPNYLTRYRMIIDISGFQFLNGYLRLPVTYILNMGYTSISHLRVFFRVNPNTGNFNEINWIYDPTTSKYILATLNGSGELIFGSNEPILPTSIDNDKLGIIYDYELYQNYPNPFNPLTNIKWQSPIGGYTKLKVYDVLGNEIATLVDEYREAGSYEIEFDGRILSSGIYFYRLSVGNKSLMKKMILMK